MDWLGDSRFRFQAAWMFHNDYFRWMEKEWAYNGDLVEALNRFQVKLLAWNKDTFGHIMKRKKRIRACLEGIQKVLRARISGFAEVRGKVEKGVV